jgi:hypothetical protein
MSKPEPAGPEQAAASIPPTESTGARITGTSFHQTQWDHVVNQLREYRKAQQQIWGDLDEIEVARYLANSATLDERAHVDKAAAEKPAIRALLDLLSVVMTTAEPAPGTAGGSWRERTDRKGQDERSPG